MGIPQKALAYILPEEYLALEERAVTKHEYLDGAIYAWQGFGPAAMAGGSKEHNHLCGNLDMALRQRLRRGPCRVFMSDVRLRIEEANAFFYPDVAVTCAEADTSPERSDTHLLREPTVVIEVLSESTETFDRGEKCQAYQRIPTLREYVLVPQSAREGVEVLRRGEAGEWARHVFHEGELVLESLDLRVPLAEVYERP